MKFLKGLLASLLSIILFLALSVFGTAYTLNQTLLKPEFVIAEIDSLDISSLFGEIVVTQTPPDAAYSAEKIEQTINELEPLLKERISATIYPIYDYLLGESPSLDLAQTLRNTFFTPDFVTSVLDDVDTAPLIADMLREQLGAIPADMAFLVEQMDDAIAEFEPLLEEQLAAAADPILAYLLGESQSLNIVISLEPLMADLKDSLREPFLASPPPELARLPRSRLESLFDTYADELLAEAVPATLTIDESLAGAETRAQVITAINETETTLEQARQYVEYFQTGYLTLIALMVLLVVAIIAISPKVKESTRQLGTTFLTYGIIGYIGIYASRFLPSLELPLPQTPPALEEWMLQFISNLLAPLETFNLGLLIGGVVLIIISFVYRPSQT